MGLPLALSPIHATRGHLSCRNVCAPSRIRHITRSMIDISDSIRYSVSFTVSGRHLTILGNSTGIAMALRYRHYKGPFARRICAACYFDPIHSSRRTRTLPRTCRPVRIGRFNRVSLLTVIRSRVVLTLPMIPIRSSRRYRISRTSVIFNRLPRRTRGPGPFTMLTDLGHGWLILPIKSKVGHG